MRLIRLGRSAENDVVVDNASVSRRHAELVLTDNGNCFLTDCNSTGGTFVASNGQWEPVRQAYVDRSAEIRLADQIVDLREIV